MTIVIFVAVIAAAALWPKAIFPLLIPVGAALFVIFSLLAIAGWMMGMGG
jgi:hypothetical protein